MIRLMIGGMIFFGVYLFAAPMIGAVNQTDINNLRAMFSGLGIVSKLMTILLIVVEKIAKTHTLLERGIIHYVHARTEESGEDNVNRSYLS